MASRFYYDPRINVEGVATELERMFISQGYQVQHFGNMDQMTVQMKRGGDFVAIIGMQTALTVTMQRSPRGMLAAIGHQQWADKAVVGAVGLVASPILWPLMITAGVGAIQQANLGTQVMNALDMLVRRQNPNVEVGPVPPELMPQYQQPGAPPQWQRWTSWARPGTPSYTGTPSNKVICANCQAANEVGDSYCMQCGHALTPPEPQKKLCPNCGAETKSNATFCTKCGTSMAQAQEGEQAEKPGT
jgi:ribosomal protein L40E